MDPFDGLKRSKKGLKKQHQYRQKAPSIAQSEPMLEPTNFESIALPRNAVSVIYLGTIDLLD
jgi:hypothetical protein